MIYVVHEFLVIKSVAFIVLTQFFHFNELNFKATRLLIFLS